MRADTEVSTTFYQSGGTVTAKPENPVKRIAHQRDAFPSAERTGLVRKPVTSRRTQTGAGREYGTSHSIAVSVAVTHANHAACHGAEGHQEVKNVYLL